MSTARYLYLPTGTFAATLMCSGARDLSVPVCDLRYKQSLDNTEPDNRMLRLVEALCLLYGP